MGQIIEFKKREKKKSVRVNDAERYKALVKGKIDVFTCDNCGSDIEVINGVYPERCPGCGLKIAHYDETEENV